MSEDANVLQLQRFRYNHQPSERISLSLCVLRLILLSAPKELTKHPCIRAPNHPARSHKHPILDSTVLSLFIYFFKRLTKLGQEFKKYKKEPGRPLIGFQISYTSKKVSKRVDGGFMKNNNNNDNKTKRN